MIIPNSKINITLETVKTGESALGFSVSSWKPQRHERQVEEEANARRKCRRRKMNHTSKYAAGCVPMGAKGAEVRSAGSWGHRDTFRYKLLDCLLPATTCLGRIWNFITNGSPEPPMRRTLLTPKPSLMAFALGL